MFDMSDETTELPPLHEITPEDSLLALAWSIGPAGLVTVGAEGDTPMAVRYLSVRGMQLDEFGEPVYSQLHIAIPSHALPEMLEAWQLSLQE